MMLTRKTSFKSLTKTPKGGMRLVIRAQRPCVIRKIDTNLSSTGPKEAVFQATRDLGKKRRLNQLIFRARKRWRAIGGFVKDEEQRGTSNSKRRLTRRCKLYSYFNDSYFEKHVDGSDLSEQNEDDFEESLAGGLSNRCGKELQQLMPQGLFPSQVNQGKGQIIP